MVGRSDLTKSFGLTKENVNDDEIYNIVKEIFTEAKHYKLMTLIHELGLEEQLIKLQELGTGTDQTPFNYMIHKNNIDLKILPYKYNMTCMPKKEILGEDMLFTKLGYVYHYNGIPDKETSVPFWMKKTYEELYEK